VFNWEKQLDSVSVESIWIRPGWVSDSQELLTIIMHEMSLFRMSELSSLNVISCNIS
jgi:hypothetical protein